MSIEVEKTDNYTLIKIKSEKLDSLLAPSLKSELVVLNANGVKNIIVDLSGSRYCDSSGLSAILVGNRLCKSNDGVFVLTGLQDPVKNVIAISQLNSVLNITNTLAEAIQMF